MTDQRIILFRGMNTGGVRVSVGDQRVMAEAIGLNNPRTLLASGNLVVESDRAPADLEAALEAEMLRRFDLSVAVMVRTPDQWAELIAANPFAVEAASDPAKLVAMVMKNGLKAGGLDACRALCQGEEAVEYADGVLYLWFADGQGSSAIFKKATPRLLGMGTGRNWNTVLKLGQMAGA